MLRVYPLHAHQWLGWMMTLLKATLHGIMRTVFSWTFSQLNPKCFLLGINIMPFLFYCSSMFYSFLSFLFFFFFPLETTRKWAFGVVIRVGFSSSLPVYTMSINYIQPDVDAEYFFSKLAECYICTTKNSEKNWTWDDNVHLQPRKPIASWAASKGGQEV